MATLSSPLSSPLPLDATPNPTSPMSVLIPSPAATSPSPLPASRYLPATASGRCKAQRWCQDTPPSGKSGDGATPLSFREVLLAAIPAAPAGSSSGPPVSPPRNAAPRILLRPAARPSLPKRGPDAKGWQQVESRRSRKARLLAERGPRRRVHADLRGRCFNCFSPDHRAAACNNRTRCFKCRRLGHRALWCAI